MRWFIAYPKPRALRDIINPQQILTSNSSFEMQIPCLLEDIFWWEKICRKLIHGHHLKTHNHQLGLYDENRRRELRTYITPLKSSHRKKRWNQGHFWQIWRPIWALWGAILEWTGRMRPYSCFPKPWMISSLLNNRNKMVQHLSKVSWIA